MSAPNRSHGKTNEAWVKMCFSKTRYSDEYTARAGAFHLFEVPETLRCKDDLPPKLWVYKCINCRGWHLTKSEVRGCTPVTAEGMF